MPEDVTPSQLRSAAEYLDSIRAGDDAATLRHHAQNEEPMDGGIWQQLQERYLNGPSAAIQIDNQDNVAEGAPEGEAPEGEAPEGEAPEGKAPEGDMTIPTTQSKRKRSSRWTCSAVVEEQCRRLRSRITAVDSRTARSEIFVDSWIVTPPPPDFRALGGEPNARWWYEQPIGVWAPEIVAPAYVSAPFCLTCERNDYVRVTGRWFDNSRGPMRVYGPFGCWWLDTMRYPCDRCHCSFRPTDPKSLSLLPPAVRGCFKVHMGSRFAADAALARVIEDTWSPMGTSPVLSMLQHWHMEAYYASCAEYWMTQHLARTGSSVTGAPAKDRAPTQNTGHVEKILVRGEAARQINKRHLDDTGGPSKRRKITIKTPVARLNSFGRSKVDLLKKINVLTVEPARSSCRSWCT